MEKDNTGDLTPKQLLFCQYYLINLNASDAARKAGYSEDSAPAIGNENLIKPLIQNHIKKLQAERSKRCEVSADDVLNELKKMGFSDLANYVNDDYKLKPLSEIKDYSASIQSIQRDENHGEFGTNVSVKFKLHDKLRALENIAKHIGFYGADNQQKNVYNVIKIHNDISSALDNDLNDSNKEDK